MAWTPELQQRVADGDTVGGREVHFRSSQYFGMVSAKYAWLNRALAIGKLNRYCGREVDHDLFEVF